MVRIKKFTSKDSDDKKSNLSKPMVTKKKSPNKKQKPSNRKLEAEKHLSKLDNVSKRKRKPSSKSVDGEKFLMDDLKIKKFNEMFLNESQVPGPIVNGSIKATITEDEARLFADEPVLHKLIEDQKVGLYDKEVWYWENDAETKEILDQYLEMPANEI